MKRTIFTTLALMILCGGIAMAQKKDTGSAKQVVEQGTKADHHLGKEIQKASLHNPPVVLNQNASDSTKPAGASLKKKKATQKISGKKH